MGHPEVEWSFGKDSDLIIEIWSTAALFVAVIAALLQEPKNLRRALEVLADPRTHGGA